MRVSEFSIATFSIQSSEGNADAPDGLVNVSVNLNDEQVVGEGFGKVTLIDTGLSSEETSQFNIFNVENINFDPGKLTFKGFMSAPPENALPISGHGILITEIK
mgnify:FL=1